MSLTPSTMVPLGSHAPDFELPDVVADQKVSLESIKGEKATVVMFLCNHCPYVKHILDELVTIPSDYDGKGVSFVGISSNDIEQYPEDGPEQMRELALRLGFRFPYLYDETQRVAKAYDAACTPDFYIYDSQLTLVYRGQLDDSRPGNGKPLTGSDLRKALDSIINGNPVDENQIPSAGCNIKWRDAPEFE